MRKSAILVALLPLAFASPALAQYPDHPINVLVPFGAGGSSDVAMRTVVPFVEKCLGGASMVVVNMPGAGGDLGFAALKEAAPDGYTIGYLNMPNIATSPLTKEAAWTIDSFDYLATVTGTNITFNVAPDSPVNTLADLIKEAKEKGPINLGISGIGGEDHLMALRFAKQNGIEFKYIPFGDGASTRLALLGGHISVASMSNSEVSNSQGELKTIGVMAAERTPFLPDVPTFREQGFDLIGGSTKIIGAPKGVPAEIAARLSGCLMGLENDPAFLEEAKTRNIPLDFMDAAESDAFVRAQGADLADLWASDPWIQ